MKEQDEAGAKRLLRRPPPPYYTAATVARGGGAEYIRENVRKLGLWHTRTVRPIMNHDELELIMTKLGFVGRGPCPCPSGVWWEYVHPQTRVGTPRPRLPYPRIDGLHMVTYAAFLDAVSFYLGIDNVADIFHVRGMQLHRIYDRHERWRRVEDDEHSVFVYRFGTLEKPIYPFSLRDFQNKKLDDYSQDESVLIRKRKTNPPTSLMVPLKDIIVPILSLEEDKVKADTI